MQRTDRLLNSSTGAGLVAIVLWSGTFALARSLSEQVGGLTAAAAVYLSGGALCLARLACSSVSFARMCQLPRRYLLGCGFLFVLYTAVVYLAVGLARNRDQVLEVALINYLWPATTIVFSLKLLNQRASLWLWPGTAFALAGVFLVMTHSAHASWHSFWDNLNSNPVVYLLALVAAVSWALYSNLARRWAAPGSDGAVELFIPITGLVLLGLRLGTVETTAWNARAVVETAALGSITAIAYVLWEMAMRKGNLLFVAACSYFTPLLSTLVSCVYLKVVPGSRLWIGCLLIVAGSLVSWRSVSDRPEAKPAADRVAPQIQ